MVWYTDHLILEHLAACKNAGIWAQPQRVMCKFLWAGSKDAHLNKHQVIRGQHDIWETLERSFKKKKLDKSCLREWMEVEASRILVIWIGTSRMYKLVVLQSFTAFSLTCTLQMLNLNGSPSCQTEWPLTIYENIMEAEQTTEALTRWLPPQLPCWHIATSAVFVDTEQMKCSEKKKPKVCFI